MENSKGPSSVKSTMYNGKNPLLPPKSPFPSIPPSPSYTEYIPKSLPKPRNVNSHHQRTSSESVLIEEQPSWLDELLDEPETPVRKGGHRRSSSDSFAYVDTGSARSVNYIDQDDSKFKNLNITPVPSWGSQDFDYYGDVRHGSFFNSCGGIRNRPWDAPVSSIAPPRGFPTHRGNNVVSNVGLLNNFQDADGNLSEKRDSVESGPQDPIGSSEKKDPSQGKSFASETDTKRAKQQFAQRSRVRKLQYIAELERNVHALQAEGSEVSAELEFLNQKNLILSMENKTLKQRLESLAQEQLIKYLEHEVLEREAVRLKSLYQKQQQPQKQQNSSTHRHSNSRDLDQQFANFSLKNKEQSSTGRDSVSGQLHI